ncbi:hypothetical protein OK024_00095 (plasmid) [Acinetobacter sp. UGAL515B_02]|nr:hypothetical protein [Acinetobacter sp. UGAL515B_02]WON79038.1 hypothetical protein OK024_00095 [Acinetobacter sp. UGAL515B_02]
MAGRKALVLTATDIKELGMHILSLPFKRRIEERCLHMLKNKKSLQDLSEQDRQLIQNVAMNAMPTTNVCFSCN